MSDSIFSAFDSVEAPMYKFTSGSLTGVANHYPRRFFRRTRRHPRSSASNSPDPIFDASISQQSCSVFGQGQTSSWLYTTPSNFNAGQADGGGTDAEKIQPMIAKEESISSSSNENKETKQEVVTNSLVIISRILKGIPQSPHFYQLRNHSDLARNRVISSWDQIFEETVEQIHSLQVNDFWVKARELWKNLEELQSMGYNVIPLRRRMAELDNMVTEQKLYKLEMKRLNIKAENHRVEKSRLEFVILNMHDMIRKEQESMNRAMDQVAEMEKELPKFEAVFAKISMKPL